MITKRKARKIYTCDTCLGKIQVGEIYEHIKERQPVFNDFENQVGIEYVQYKTCPACIKKEEKLTEKQNNCKHENAVDNGDPDYNYLYCLDCEKTYKEVNHDPRF